MGGSVNVVTPEGERVSIPEDALDYAVQQGYRRESPGGEIERATREGKVEGYGVNTLRGQIKLAVSEGLGGLSLGATTYLEAQDPARREEINLGREEHPVIAGVSQAVGMLAPAIVSGGTGAAGALARATPAGRFAQLGSRIAELGAGKGIVRETAALAAGGALEGGVQATGQYIADQALADKDISAEGLLGHFAKGGLWGGGAGGVMGFAAGTLKKIAPLFAKGEVTEQAAQLGERQAASEMGSALRDTDDLEAAARAHVSGYRTARTSTDPVAAGRAAEIRAAHTAAAAPEAAAPTALGHADQLRAAKLTKAEADAGTSVAKRAIAEERLAKLKAPKAPRGKGAPPVEVAPAAPAPAPATAIPSRATPPPGDDDLLAKLAESTERLKAGAKIDDLSAEVRPPPRGGAKAAPAPAAPAELPLTTRARAAFDRIPEAEWHGGSKFGGKVPLSTVRREMGLSSDDFERWVREAADRGEVIPSRLDAPGMYSPDQLAEINAGTIRDPVGEWQLLEFPPPPRVRTPPARAAVDVEREVDHAIADLDPGVARVRDAANDLAESKQRVRDWLSNARKESAERAETEIAAGTRSRGRDVVGELRPGGVSAGTEVRGTRTDYVSRMRNPYTNEELAARSAANPTFRDHGAVEHGAPAAMTARDDLVDRILMGQTKGADLELEQQALEGGRLRTVRRPATGEDVLAAVKAQQPDVDELVLKALRGRLDLPDDLSVAIPAIQHMERAEADLVEALGPDRVPPGSARRAAAYREAMASHGEAQSLADLQAAQAVGDAAGPVLAQQAAAKGVLGHAADLGSALEVLSSLNVPGLPSAKDIPLVGPLLSLYLKARAATSVWRRLGGKLPASAETEIAGRAAATRNRMRAAVHGLLDAGERGVRAAARPAPLAAEILGRRLFADDRDGKHKPAPKESIAQLWAARAGEIQRAQQPGALAAALRDRVRTSDPVLAQAIHDGAARKISYLAEQMPRPPPGAPIGSAASPWRPPDSEVERFARVVDALDDPAGVLERAIGGAVSIDQVKAIRAVYPRLYAEAQTELLDGACGREDVPYRRRCQLGVLFEIPLDPTQEPAFRAKQQAGLSPQPPPASPPSAMPAQPVPSLLAPLGLSAANQLHEQT